MCPSGFLMVGDGQDYAEKKPGLKRHLLVRKVDRAGTPLWQLDLGDRGWNYGKFGIELPDGTFAISGAMTVNDPSFGDSLHRSLIRLDKNGAHMQTLLLENANKAEHRMDGFTGIALGHDPDHAFVVTGVVGADNATSSFADAMMFLPPGRQTRL